MKWNSPEERIIRFLVKVDPENPIWADNPNVQRVLTKGVIDFSKLQVLFVERNICTAQEFSDVLTILRAKRALDANDQLTAGARSLYEDAKARYEADVAALGSIDFIPSKATPQKRNAFEAIQTKEY